MLCPGSGPGFLMDVQKQDIQSTSGKYLGELKMLLTPLERGGDNMDALQAIKTRRSIRKFEKKPIPKDILESIVDCGRLAASGRNDQPWEFVVVTDSEIKNQIAATTDYGKFIAQAAACIAVFCRDTTYYLEDGAAASQNILVGAWAQGVGTCWIAGDKKHYAETIGEIVGAPKGTRLVSLIALGYPAEQPTREKRELKDVLHWNRF